MFFAVKIRRERLNSHSRNIGIGIITRKRPTAAVDFTAQNVKNDIVAGVKRVFGHGVRHCVERDKSPYISVNPLFAEQTAVFIGTVKSAVGDKVDIAVHARFARITAACEHCKRYSVPLGRLCFIEFFSRLITLVYNVVYDGKIAVEIIGYAKPAEPYRIPVAGPQATKNRRL